MPAHLRKSARRDSWACGSACMLLAPVHIQYGPFPFVHHPPLTPTFVPPLFLRISSSRKPPVRETLAKVVQDSACDLPSLRLDVLLAGKIDLFQAFRKPSRGCLVPRDPVLVVIDFPEKAQQFLAISLNNNQHENSFPTGDTRQG